MSRATATRSGKEYRRPMPVTWFLGHRNYTVFMLREFSSVFIAVVVLLQLYLAWAALTGPEAWERALGVFLSPGVVIFHFVALAFVLLHVVTWFHLNAWIMQIRTGEQVWSRAWVKGGSWLAWVIVTGALFWLLVG